MQKIEENVIKTYNFNEKEKLSMTYKIGIFGGTFDPFTEAHLDVLMER